MSRHSPAVPYRDDVELTHTPPPPQHRYSYSSPAPSEREDYVNYHDGAGSTVQLNQHPGSYYPNLRAYPGSPTPNLSESQTLAGTPLPDDKDMYKYQPVSGVRQPRYTDGGKSRSNKRKLVILGTLGIIVLVVAAIIIPIYFAVIKPNNDKSSSSSSSSGGSSSGNPSSPTGALSGGDGSTILAADGSSFVYTNKFGGTWYYDPAHPFANNAQAQSDTPALNTSWTWGKDRIRGVNLGGWFVLEPFIAPALFQKYPGASDEWALSQAMRADTGPGGGIGQIEDHYKTFITEQDFAQIAGAGLNWVRLPIPYWAIETYAEEPFLAKTCWPYILQALQWARKYGLRVNLDLHTAPGSQNGYNHSGKGGQINFLNGMMGVANAQRLLGYIRVITEFISQDEWKDVVPLFGMINEVRVQVVGKDQVTSFYLEAHDMIRNITGIGNGPFLSIHDGFVTGGISNWTGFLQGSDRIALDTHPYFAFDGAANNEPLSQQPAKACNAWGPGFNVSQSGFGVTLAGEFSNGINDCGFYLLGTGNPTTSYESNGGNCSDWTIWEQWDDTKKAGLKAYALASMDALFGSWFFWTWKIGNETQSGSVRSPLWSYQLGLEQGWMPTSPQDSVGACQSAGVQNPTPAPSTYSSWQTGGAGAGTIDPNSVAEFGQFPPQTILNLIPPNAPVSLLPTYTATGPIPTLPPPTLTAGKSTVAAGNGWADPSDTVAFPTPISACSYPDPWNAVSVSVPSTVCPGTAAKRTAMPEPVITPA